MDLAVPSNLRYEAPQMVTNASSDYSIPRIASDNTFQGTKVRVNPGAVVFQSAQAFRDIYGTKSNVQRSKSYEVWQRNEMDVNTINTSDVGLHHKKRRYLNLVFTEKSVRAAGVFIQKHVDFWDKLLPDGDGRDWSQPKNMAEWSDYLVFDILCDLCFGRSLNIKEPGENPFKGIPKAIHSYMKLTYPVRSTRDQTWWIALIS